MVPFQELLRAYATAHDLIRGIVIHVTKLFSPIWQGLIPNLRDSRRGWIVLNALKIRKIRREHAVCTGRFCVLPQELPLYRFQHWVRIVC